MFTGCYRQLCIIDNTPYLETLWHWHQRTRTPAAESARDRTNHTASEAAEFFIRCNLYDTAWFRFEAI